MASDSNFPPAYALLGEQISSLMAAKDQHIHQLEEELTARTGQLDVCKQRLDALNNALNQRSQQVQSLTLEMRQLRAGLRTGAKALVGNGQADTPPKSPDNDVVEVSSPTKSLVTVAVVAQRKAVAIAAIRSIAATRLKGKSRSRQCQGGVHAHITHSLRVTVFACDRLDVLHRMLTQLPGNGFKPLPQEDAKHLERSHRCRDEGADLRALVGERAVSSVRAMELKPGTRWRLILIAPDEDEGASNDVEMEAHASPTMPPSGPRHQDRKHSLPDTEDGRRRRKPVCEHCWATSSWCDFYSQCESCRMAGVRCVRKLCELGLSCRSPRCPGMHPGQWDENDEDWIVEPGVLSRRSRAHFSTTDERR